MAKSVATDDKRKDLRYAIGKELAKYNNSAFADPCIKYLTSKDATTVSLGLDMYKTGKYSSAEATVKSIALDKKANAGNRARAQKMLGIDGKTEAAK